MRLQGTTDDIKKVLDRLSGTNGIEVSNVSKPFANYGTLDYYRVYGEIELDDKNYTGRRKSNEQSHCNY